MLSCLLGIVDSNFVKVSKENWTKIEQLLSSKNKLLSEQESILIKQARELQILRHYKANDDLLYSYENDLQLEKQKTAFLKKELLKVSKGVEKANKKLDFVMSLESAYLETINQNKSKNNRYLFRL